MTSADPFTAVVEVPERLLEIALAECRFMVDQILSHPYSTSEIGAIQIRILQTLQPIAGVVKDSTRENCYSIDISTGFLGRLLHVIFHNPTVLREACSDSIQDYSTRLVFTNSYFVRLWVFSVRFTVAHELCHLICGHIGLWEEVQKEPNTLKNNLASARELDADGTAITLIAGHTFCLDPITAKTNGLGCEIETDKLIAHLDGPAKLIGFRVTLLSSWVAMSVLHEYNNTVGQMPFYPLPGCRLINVALMLEFPFSNRTSRKVELGDGVDTLISELEKRADYLDQVFWPCFDRISQLDDHNPLKELLISQTGNCKSFLTKSDVTHLFLGFDRVSSEIAEQLVSSEHVRTLFNERLDKHRKWKELSLE